MTNNIPMETIKTFGEYLRDQIGRGDAVDLLAQDTEASGLLNDSLLPVQLLRSAQDAGRPLGAIQQAFNEYERMLDPGE